MAARNISGSDAHFVNGNRSIVIYHITNLNHYFRDKNRSCCSYGVFAGIALGMMMVGALGMNIVPKEYFGIVERFSVFAATGFQAVLGMHLYRMELNN